MSEEIYAAVAASLIKDSVSSVVKGVSGFTDQQIGRLEVALKTCFHDYTKRIYQRTSMIKTLVERTEPVPLFERFVSPDLCPGTNRRRNLDRDGAISADEFLGSLKRGSRYLITATAGAGKSMIMKYITARSIKNRVGYIPIFVELRMVNELTHDKIYDYIFHSIKATNDTFERDQFDLALKSGKFCLILDGFDEVVDAKKDMVSIQIRDLAFKYDKCPIVVSSRPEDRFVAWEDFTELFVAPLKRNSSIELISKIKFSEKVKDDFVGKMKKELWNTHEEFLSNPLLASMMLVTFESTYDIPTKRHLFYQKAFIALVEKHDAYKEYKRERKSGLDFDEFEKVFSAFCIMSFMDGKLSFDLTSLRSHASNAIKLCAVKSQADQFIEDLVKNICIIVQDGSDFVFLHRSFQEYFVARFISKLPPARGQKILLTIRERYHEREVFRLLFGLDQDYTEKNLVLPCIANVLDLKSQKAAEKTIELAHRVCAGLENFVAKEEATRRLGVIYSFADQTPPAARDFRTLVNLYYYGVEEPTFLRNAMPWFAAGLDLSSMQIKDDPPLHKKTAALLSDNANLFSSVRIALEKLRKELLTKHESKDAFLDSLIPLD